MANILNVLAAGMVDSLGAVLVNGKVYTYQSGTTTPQVVYADTDLSIPLANPIILDSAGRVEAYSDQAVRIVVFDSNDNQILDFEDVTINEQEIIDQLKLAPKNASTITLDIPGSGDDFDAGPNETQPTLDDALKSSVTSFGGRNFNFKASGVGAVERTIQSKLSEIYDIVDYGAVGDDSTDNTAFIQAAIDACELAGSGEVYVPEGIFRHTGLTFANGLSIKGSGWNSVLKNTSSSNHSISNSVTGANTFGFRIAEIKLTHSGSGSSVDGIHIVSASNHISIDRVMIEFTPRDGIYLEGTNGSNIDIIYPVIYSPLVSGPGRHGIWINGTCNSGVLIGGRLEGAASGYNLKLDDTSVGGGSFPNTWTVYGVDLPGSSPLAGLHENGQSNRYYGLRFEGNTVDIVLGTASGNAMFFGNTKQTGGGPVITNNAPTRPIMFDKQNRIREFESGGFFEYFDEPQAAIRKIGGVFYKPAGATIGNTSTTETTLWTKDLPANVLGDTGSSIEFELSGSFAANGNTKTMTLYFGAQTHQLISSTPNNVNWRFKGSILRTAISGQYRFEGLLVYGTTVSVLDALISSQNFATVNTLKLTGTGGATNDILSKTVSLKTEPGTA